MLPVEQLQWVGDQHDGDLQSSLEHSSGPLWQAVSQLWGPVWEARARQPVSLTAVQDLVQPAATYLQSKLESQHSLRLAEYSSKQTE